MALFSDKKIEQFFAENDKKAVAQITTNPLPTEERIVEVAGIIAKHNIIPTVEIKPEETKTEVTIEQISGRHLGPTRFADPNKSYPFAAVIYRTPVVGNTSLLFCSPRTSVGHGSDAILTGNTLTFKFKTEYGNANLSPEVESSVKQAFINEVQRVKTNIQNLNAEVEKYNQQLESRLQVTIREKVADFKVKKEREDRLNPFS